MSGVSTYVPSIATLVILARTDLQFWMFIFEESIQSLGMACYLLIKVGKTNEAAEIAQVALDEYINPMIDRCNDSEILNITFPVGLSFLGFYEASKLVFEGYVNHKYDA